MHIKVTFFSKEKIILNINYNHIIQAFIYKIIDEKLSTFLHDIGFGDSRKFKMFSFSRLYGKYDIKSNPGNIIFQNEVNFIISSPYDKFCESFANGIMKKRVKLEKNELEVISVETNPIIVKNEEITIESLSPIVVYSTLLKPEGSKYTVYFQPGEKEFEEHINKNLINKLNIWDSDIFKKDTNKLEKVKILSYKNIKQNIVNYKDFIIKGYSGTFTLKGPIEFLQIGVDAGFGSKNSMGFGCVKIK